MSQTAPITDGQVGQVGGYAEVAARESGLNREQLQGALGRGGEMKAQFMAVISSLGLPVDPYPDEEATQVWFYPKDFAVQSLDDQAQRLRRVLGIEPKWAVPVAELPELADGIGLWPILPALGTLWEIADPRGTGYGKVIATVCDKIHESEEMAPFVNYRMQGADELTLPDYVRIASGVLDILVPLEEQAMAQGFNCLALPTNFGDWRTGKCFSPRRALWQTLNFPPRRLAIEPVAGLSLLIGNRERLTAYEQLFMDLSGAQYNWRGGGWSGSLYVDFYGGRFGLNARGAGGAYGGCGSLFARVPGVSELAA